MGPAPASADANERDLYKLAGFSPRGPCPGLIQQSRAPYNAFMHCTDLSASLAAFALAVFLGSAAVAQNALPTASAEDRALAREIFKQLIEINTTDTPQGNVTTATAAMQKRFLEAGFPPEDVHLLGPDPRKQNLVVRLRAAGPTTEKPILFLCHMDVVQALRSDWHTDPFQFIEQDGYYYGRGTQDMKNSDAALVATFLRLHKEGYKPRRDLILALTADEESGKFNVTGWLVREPGFSIPTRAAWNWNTGARWWPMWKPRKRSIPIFRLRRPIAADTAPGLGRTMRSMN
jgi:hypothetical protein